MGTCLKCHKKIRDGQKYCDSCKQKRKNKADESYLDSLLSSVGINSSKISTQTAPEAPVRQRPKAPVKEQQPAEVDEMLSDLLADMDSAGPMEPEGDVIIR